MTCDESYESHECILLIAFLIEEGHIFMTRAGHTVILSDQALKNWAFSSFAFQSF